MQQARVPSCVLMLLEVVFQPLTVDSQDLKKKKKMSIIFSLVLEPICFGRSQVMLPSPFSTLLCSQCQSRKPLQSTKISWREKYIYTPPPPISSSNSSSLFLKGELEFVLVWGKEARNVLCATALRGCR